MNKYEVRWFNGVEYKLKEELYLAHNIEELQEFLEEEYGARASKRDKDEPKFKIELVEENIKIPLKINY